MNRISMKKLPQILRQIKSEVNADGARSALSRWLWSIRNDNKQTFVHGQNGRKICVVNIQTGPLLLEIAEVNSLADLKAVNPRQQMRSERRRKSELRNQIKQRIQRLVESGREVDRSISEFRQKYVQPKPPAKERFDLEDLKRVYGNTMVRFLRVGMFTHALVYFDGEERQPEAYMYELSDETNVRLNKKSKNLRTPENLLVAKGWRATTLSDERLTPLLQFFIEKFIGEYRLAVAA